MPLLNFTISRRNELLTDDETVGRFTSEAAAADVAIRHAQDNHCLYTITYERRR